MDNCCDKKDNKKGFSRGILYGLIPHVGCLLFLIFTILGITVLSAVFKPLLLNRYFFYFLILFSLILVTISALISLKRSSFLSISGVKKKWKYLLTLYGTTITVNLLLFLVVFPYAANFRINSLWATANIANSENIYSKLTLQVDIPCSGHAPLVIDELKKIEGVGDIKFRLPNYFDISYDSQKIFQEKIISADIFKEFKPKIIKN